jgi:hypothetical protein
MVATYTEADFERLSWHDNLIYGLRLDIGDIDVDDWRSELVLDIDHIVEWVRGDDARIRFRVAPADLTFHGVTDLRLGVDWGDSGHRTSLSEMSIAGIERHRIENQMIFLDRPYYRWVIELNSPAGGEIGFGAVGFTLVLRAEPLLIDEQKLKPTQRPPPPAG